MESIGVSFLALSPVLKTCFKYQYNISKDLNSIPKLNFKISFLARWKFIFKWRKWSLKLRRKRNKVHSTSFNISAQKIIHVQNIRILHIFTAVKYIYPFLNRYLLSWLAFAAATHFAHTAPLTFKTLAQAAGWLSVKRHHYHSRNHHNQNRKIICN